MIVRYKDDFQHVWAFQELQQMIDMLYVRQMAETFLSALLLMFISSCYLIYNARRDTERIWHYNADDAGARSSSEAQEKNGRKKQLLTKTCKCYKASKFL